MKKIFLALLGLSLATPIFAQSTLPPSYQEQEEQKAIYRAEAETLTDLVHTKLDLKFDYQKEHVLGEAWITAHPHFYPTNQLELDAKAMLIHEVKLVNGKKTTPLKFKSDEWKIWITLDKTYKKGEDYTVYIKYTARPNEVKQEGSAAISDAKGLYFIDPRDEDPEKPTQIWTQGETESSSCWFPTIDKPNQKTSQEIYLTVPDKYVTLSNGALESQKKAANGMRTDYWNFDKKHAPYLFFIAVGDFKIVQDTPWKGKTVDYYLEEEYAPYAKEIFGDTPAMLTFFSDLLDYEYPWNKYSQIVCRDYVSGAMENTTAVIFGESVHAKSGDLIDENRAERIVAHELFHHWFGDLVTTESWGNLSLNESFANYSEYLWFEHKYGKEYADEHRKDDIAGYLASNSYEKNLIRRHYNSREDMFDGVSYNKGGYILHMLRSFLGDDAFFKGLNHYLKENAYGKAEAAQLRIAMEHVSGRDLNWFFDQWYFGNGHPQLEISSNYDTAGKKLSYTITQTQEEPLFEFPYTIDIVVNGKTERKTFWVAKQKENTFDFALEGKPEVVIPNANQDLLATLVEKDKSAAEYAAQYTYGKGEFQTRSNAIAKLAEAQVSDEVARNTLISALSDPYHGIRKEALDALDMENPKVKEKAMKAILQIAKSDPNTLTQAKALRILGESGSKDAGLFERGLSSKSNAVQAASVGALIQLFPDKASTYAEKLSDEVIASSPSLIGSLLPVWIAENNLSKVGMVAETSSFYAFTKFQDPELGAKLEEGFKWAFAQDDMGSTQKFAATYKQVYNQVKDNQPQALPFLKSMLQEALKLKGDAYKAKASTSLEKQVETLQEVLALYNK